MRAAALLLLAAACCGAQSLPMGSIPISVAPSGPNVFSVYAGKTGDGVTVVTPDADSTGSTMLTLIVGIAGKNPTSVVITDSLSAGNVWNNLNGYTDGAGVNIAIWYCFPTVTGPGHHLTVASTAYGGLVFSGWNGPTAYGSVQDGGGQTMLTHTFAVGPVTPSATNSFVITGVTLSVSTSPGKSSLSIDGGFAIPTGGVIWNGDDSGPILGTGVAFLQQTSIAAAAPTWMWVENTTVASAIAVFH